jgi:predicted secreted Zn-dependent protease
MRGTVTEVRQMTHPKKHLVWRRSQSCGNGACVEVAKADDRYLVRDSKNPDAAPLSFTRDEWVTFIQGVEAGDFRF